MPRQPPSPELDASVLNVARVGGGEFERTRWHRRLWWRFSAGLPKRPLKQMFKEKGFIDGKKEWK